MYHYHMVLFLYAHVRMSYMYTAQGLKCSICGTFILFAVVNTNMDIKVQVRRLNCPQGENSFTEYAKCCKVKLDQGELPIVTDNV